MNAHKTSRLRIIGGHWRRRNLEFLDLSEIRPTPNRVRETLFNWLAPRIEGAVCLDLFAGSGALGFEAMSRGAASATLIESNRRVCAQIESEITRFDATAIKVVNTDALDFIQQAHKEYDIIFLDPPFGSGLVHKTLHALTKNRHALAPTSLVYAEWEAQTDIVPPAGLNILRHDRASEVQYALFGRHES